MDEKPTWSPIQCNGMQWLSLFHSPSGFVLNPPQVVDLTQNQGTVIFQNITTLSLILTYCVGGPT